jgi:subtilisin family serine protease
MGGRQPVDYQGPAPQRDESLSARRPVVAVLDTGVWDHDWLKGVVTRDAVVGGQLVGLPDPEADAEAIADHDDPYEGQIDTDIGHGTFICGLIRQKCPDAELLSVRVMRGDGVVYESDLVQALSLLADRQEQAVLNGPDADLIDVVSLSLGYYHEFDTDLQFDSGLLATLERLAHWGVATVVAAGNDSTDRPMFPAAFAPWPGGPVFTDGVPVTSVGALNPNKTVALFSNAGPWVLCHRPGAALLSCFPEVNGSSESSYKLYVPDDGWRATVDPDDFSRGFAVWSGTSFAAPLFAGEIAAELLQRGTKRCDRTDMVTRCSDAVSARVKVRQQ